eukprot:CAMPEP_0181334330 /NCGR_PEP_ID=MMETSP1101-20121128/26187_1 /TAXON_ID=46948 /ORGANISM="Rhodomonas abbreviata, Strain Caron Lab Isolate" /LENGTH=65 /DNA_ID=CAMNT_0023444269 /DNA_START=129 /DNA_END=326 /DNA_ORIENTATION=-
MNGHIEAPSSSGSGSGAIPIAAHAAGLKISMLGNTNVHPYALVIVLMKSLHAVGWNKREPPACWA